MNIEEECSSKRECCAVERKPHSRATITKNHRDLQMATRYVCTGYEYTILKAGKVLSR